MFGKRYGARRLKTLNPYDRIVGFIMKKRYDALVYFSDTIDCAPIDEFIARVEAEKGVRLSYLDLFNAGTVRTYAKKPQLNRFFMNGNMYANDKISISMAIKKALRSDSESTTIKVDFTGHENIFEVRDKFHEEIMKNKAAASENSTDKLMATLMNLPSFIINPAISFLMWLDKINALPRSIIDASPFHGSVFITYLKSLGIRSIYHHIYDFGTIGMFIAVGKEQYVPAVDRKTKEIVVKKQIELMVVADERICDGLYHAQAMKYFRTLMENPDQLTERLETVERDID